MSWIWDNDKEEKEERSHQDNFPNSFRYFQPKNGQFQYCPFCKANRRFEYDRCSECHNN